METKLFAEELMDMVRFRLGNGYLVTIREVLKNNDTRLESLSIQKGDESVAPVFYVQDYYRQHQEGRTLESIADEIVRAYESNIPGSEILDEMSRFDSFETVKDKVVLQLINTEKNQERLKDIANLPYLDFSIIFKVLFDTPPLVNATITVSNSLLKTWGISLKELYFQAFQNTRKRFPIQIQGMDEILFDFAPELFFERDIKESITPMYVLSNNKKYNGSINILFTDILETFSEQIQNSFYILPSSIHELILLPDEDLDPKELVTMVREVNQTTVYPEDFLSDNIYYYSRASRQIKIINL